jgi:predicted nucleic acid-binding protein
MAAEPVFIDSNVLVYASRDASQFYQAATDALIRLEDENRELVVSQQVLREFLVAVTRSQHGVPPRPRREAIAEVQRLMEIYPLLEDGSSVTDRLLMLMERIQISGKQVHDANIVATMLAHNVIRLLTFNGADFRRFEPMIEILAS